MNNFRVIKFKKTPIICNIPHNSTRIPPDFFHDFSGSKSELKREARQMADLHSDALFKPLLKNFGGLVANFSRIVTDVERLINDKDESMARVGMGALYTKSSAGKTIRQLTAAARNRCLSTLYIPYHQTLTRQVEKCLTKFGRCLILDCHTFPSRPRSYEQNKQPRRPDICLGQDKFHTPPLILKNLKQSFSRHYTVKINNPFSGTVVPLEYYRKNKSVQSIMIEVNRKLYMNERTFQRTADFKKISRVICEIIMNNLKNV